MSVPTLTTPRLILRQWRDDDLPTFAQMNVDPRVMAFFPALLSREASDTLAARIRQKLDENEFGLWAVEIPGVADFAGFVGLAVPTFDAHFTPCVEVGWRLARGSGFRANQQPEKPASGKLMLRIRPEVHAAVSIAAQAAGKSINQWADEVLGLAAHV